MKLPTKRRPNQYSSTTLFWIATHQLRTRSSFAVAAVFHLVEVKQSADQMFVSSHPFRPTFTSHPVLTRRTGTHVFCEAPPPSAPPAPGQQEPGTNHFDKALSWAGAVICGGRRRFPPSFLWMDEGPPMGSPGHLLISPLFREDA